MGNSNGRIITISWTINRDMRFSAFGTFDTRRRNEPIFTINDLGCRLTLNNNGTVSLRHPSEYTIKDHYIRGTIYHIDLIPNTQLLNTDPSHHIKLLHVTHAIENIHIVRA